MNELRRQFVRVHLSPRFSLISVNTLFLPLIFLDTASAQIPAPVSFASSAFPGSSRTITRYWHLKYGTLRGFFSYAVTRGYLSTSPLPATVPKPPLPR